MAINSEIGGPKIDRESFHKLGMLRNAFAHADVYGAKHVNLDANAGPIGAFFAIKTLKPDGAIRVLRRSEAKLEFEGLIRDIEEQLVVIESLL